MQPYKEYFIEGTALLIHPFSPFSVSMKELAEWFGLELSRIVVDECLAWQAQNTC
jgi:hypothetical protein